MRFAIGFLVLALGISAALAEEEKNGESCDGSTLEMVQCLQRLTDKWDKRLNAAYQQAVKDAVNPVQREQLRAAQRLWIQYRDANCKFYGLGEGTIARLDAGECMRAMTEARALELEGVGYRN